MVCGGGTRRARRVSLIFINDQCPQCVSNATCRRRGSITKKQPDCVEAQSQSREWTMTETYYDLMRRQGISRRSFLKFCSLTAASLGLGDAGAQQIAQAMQTKPRTPVIWLHGLECTCCSESFIRSSHPLAKDVVLSMISLDYDDTLMAAAGYQAEEQLEKTIEKYKGNYILAVEGNPPLADDGVYCIPGGKPFVEKLRRVAKDAKAIISWGSCASWGCVQAAKPNPTQATPVHKVITDKPIIRVPGCPPIAEVMTGVVTYVLTFDRLPDMDAQGRPKMFYSQRIHDKCYRRPHFDAGQFVEHFDDAGARQGFCLYKVGCRGPVTYNACSTVRWNEGTSFPIQSGHGCIGCSEDAFWDKGSFYDHLTTIRPPGGLGIEGTADRIGLTAVAVAGAAVAAHAAVSAIKQARSKTRNDQVSETEK
jgi:hydrogenase small subunit